MLQFSSNLQCSQQKEEICLASAALHSFVAMNLRDVFLCVGLVLLTFQSAICDDVFPTYRDDIVDQARNIITVKIFLEQLPLNL